MARLLVLCALIGCALAVPTPQSLPKSILGTYENVPSESKNFDEFVKVFGLPKHAKFDRNNLIGFWKEEGDKYVQRFRYWPTTVHFDLPFKLGETQTITIMGKQYEYVYTLETGSTPETPVLRAKFRQTDGDVKFTVEAQFTKSGIDVTYARDNVVAKRHYRQTLPPYVMGLFEADSTTVSDEALTFFNTMFPLPGSLKWNKEAQFWIGRDESDPEYFVDKMIVDPTFYYKLKFRLNEPQTITHGTETLKVTYTLVDSNTTITTIRSETTCSKGTLVSTFTFDRKGCRIHLKSADKEFTSYYRRTLPTLAYGTFEEVPEKTENWEEFMKGDEGCKMSDAVKKYTVYRGKSQDEFAVRKVVNGTKNMDVTFKLDTPTEVTLPNGKTMKLNITVVSGNNTYIVGRTEVGEKKFTMEKLLKPCGIVETYRRGDVEAKKYFRRVLPKTVFGTFESPEITDEDFKKHATEHGMADWTKKTTIEMSESADHKLQKKLTIDGQEPKEMTLRLGEPVEFKAPSGKTVQAKQIFYIMNNKPTFRAWYTVDGKLRFQIASVFRPDGFDSTYVYGDQTHGGEKIVKRSFTRKGEAVPFEPESTN